MAGAAVACVAIPPVDAAPVPEAPMPQQLPPTFVVPDVVEDRRSDTAGNIITRRYLRGALLGKVSGRDALSSISYRRYILCSVAAPLELPAPASIVTRPCLASAGRLRALL